MKRTMILAAVLVALAATATAQLAEGDTPALTNNVQFVWGTNQAVALKALWNEDFASQIAAWNTATNADPTYADSNSVPVKSTFAVWAAAWTKPIVSGGLVLCEAQRKWRLQQAATTANKALADLWVEAFGLLTPAQQAAQSNLLWAAKQANQ